MPLNCGIVGLPNVGKSTLFSALTAAPAAAENYPFCTIDPNIGIVTVPDQRLERLAAILAPPKTIPAAVEFVDIAGLVKGASKGEGLGNQFLAQIREVGLIIHVVRCFEDEDVVHVTGAVDPVSDVETVNVELALADLQTVDRRLERIQRDLRSPQKDVAKHAESAQAVLLRVRDHLQEGRPARILEMEDAVREILAELHLLTMKPQLYVCNVAEGGGANENAHEQAVRELAEAEGSQTVSICAQLEAEIAELGTDEERRAFLEEAGLEESGLARLVPLAYHRLGLRTFFTHNEKELRAWTYRDGSSAYDVAGIIHTDFQKGFIKAEVYRCEDLFAAGSERALREAGTLRTEGRDYPVQDGDVILFRFNV
jgi:hypothetical protein